MARPRLIATDLDGTFLTTAKTVSPLNLAAAQRAAQLGVPLVVATGRPVRWLDVVDQLGLAHSQVIVSNGAAVYDLASRTVVRSHPLDSELALQVARELKEVIPGISFGFETPTGFGCEPESPSRQRGEPGVQEGSLEELASGLGPVIKLLGFHTELDSDALVAAAEAVVTDRLTLTHALVGDAYGMLELTASGVSKASTLAALCAEQVTTFHIADPDDIDMAANSVRFRTTGPHHAEDEQAPWIPTDGPLRVGITAGASTPNNKIGEAVARIFAIRGIDPASIT